MGMVSRRANSGACMHAHRIVCISQGQCPGVGCCVGTNHYYDGDGGAGESEMFPYVSFTISVDG